MTNTTNISILAWNVRGAANASCKRNLKEVVRQYRHDFCFIFETHVPSSRLHAFWARQGYKALAVEEAQGHSGGIWAMGLVSLPLTVEVVDSHPQAVSLCFSSSSASWTCTGVYASTIPTAR